MSATINAELFASFFNAPIIEIPGRMYPVQITYLPVEEPDRNLVDPKSIEDRKIGKNLESIRSIPKRMKTGPFLNLLKKIDEDCPETERGHLLVFLSGMNEISLVGEELRPYAMESRRWIILELHSSLAVAEQEKVFDITPPG